MRETRSPHDAQGRHVAFGSAATDSARAENRSMSGMPRKRTQSRSMERNARRSGLKMDLVKSRTVAEIHTLLCFQDFWGCARYRR